MNLVFIVGNLTKDPESRTTNSGANVCSFTVAVNRRQKKQDGTNEADFFRISAFGEMGKACQQYLAKGRKVAVVGRISVNAYQGQDGQPRGSLEVFAQDVEFLTPRDGGSSDGGAHSSAPAPAPMPTNVPDDQLPF